MLVGRYHMALTVVLPLVIFVHKALSLLSHRLWRHSDPEAHLHTNRHFGKPNVVGNFVFALVVSSLCLFSTINHWKDFSTIQTSSVSTLSAEISVCFWLTEIMSSFNFRDSTGGLLHHVLGILSLLMALYYRGILLELVVVKQLSQLSVVLLIARLLLLDWGMSGSFAYLATFTAQLVFHFVTRLSTIPWVYWRILDFVSETPEVTPAITLGLLIVCMDLLNIYWFYRMIRTYWKYYPDRFRLSHVSSLVFTFVY